MRRLLAAAVVSVFGASGWAVAEGPRVVSLDYCADQFVIGLADPDQILALSTHSRREFSHYRDAAAQFPQVRAQAEDVILLAPDLVVRSYGGDARMLALLERAGINVVQIGYAEDFEGISGVVKAVAGALGQAERGDMRARALTAVPQPPAGDRAVLYLTPGGTTSGPGTLIDSVLSAAGLENAVTVPGWHTLPLEQLVLDPPALVVTAFFDTSESRADNWNPGRHPVLGAVLEGAETVRLDDSRISCASWLVAEEAAALAKVMER